MPANHAAYLTAKKAVPLEVRHAPYTPPSENEIVIKNGAVAINPVDCHKQTTGDIMFAWIKYPAIFGSDLAGEVVEVGKGVSRFHVGDRVVGHAVGIDKRANKAAEGAFQEYTVIRETLASPIPSSMSYENASVLPLCLSTAACGMYMKDFLALEYPSVNPKPTGETLLIWGGSTSLGSNAIQLAIASGYEVITTCSPKNFEYVKKLGASQAFDYRSTTVVKDIIAAFRNKTSAGALAIGSGSCEACIDIIAAAKGKKFVSQASVTMPEGPMVGSGLGMYKGFLTMAGAMVSVKAKSAIKSVGVKFIWGSDLMANEVGKLIYEDFLPAALAQVKYIAAPEPQTVGKGLDKIQEALNLSKKGVSARKLIVTL